VKRAAIAVSICVGIVPTSALAYDWSIKAAESQTVEVNSNLLLRNSPAVAVGSYSTLSANAEASTATSKLDFYGDGNYKKYWGPGIDGSPSEFLDYGFRARYEHSEKSSTDREFLETSWRQQSTSLALLGQLGVFVNTGGFIDRLTASGGFDRALTATDTVSIFATSSHSSYEPSSGGTPFDDTLARGSWRHAVNSIAAVTASSEAELLSYGNTLGTEVQIYRNQIGADLTISPLLSFRANAGPVYIETQNGASSSPIGGSAVATGIPSAVADWIGDAVLTYRLLKNTTLTANASQSVGPSIVGSLFKTDTLALSLIHTINSNSSVSFSATGNRSIATTTTDYASASATYNYNLAREWLAQFTYRYSHRFASSGGGSTIDPITRTPTVGGIGAADSHSIMMVVSHNWTILPSGN
jgi:hypothetical protein